MYVCVCIYIYIYVCVCQCICVYECLGSPSRVESKARDSDAAIRRLADRPTASCESVAASGLCSSNALLAALCPVSCEWQGADAWMMLEFMPTTCCSLSTICLTSTLSHTHTYTHTHIHTHPYTHAHAHIHTHTHIHTHAHTQVADY